jgi:hypothetical protein
MQRNTSSLGWPLDSNIAQIPGHLGLSGRDQLVPAPGTLSTLIVDLIENSIECLLNMML